MVWDLDVQPAGDIETSNSRSSQTVSTSRVYISLELYSSSTFWMLTKRHMQKKQLSAY
jgi:hypothetical protein